MNSKLTILIAGAFAWLAFPGLPFAQNINANDPNSIVSALQELGFRASLETDSEGDPSVASSVDGSKFWIYFYGCRDNANCKYLQFSYGIDLTDGTTLDAVNEWNRRKLVGRVYLDSENDPWLEYFITTVGGLNSENFTDAVEWWEVIVPEFKKHFDF